MSSRPPDNPLRRSDLDADPVEQFRQWFATARQAAPMPEAMTLCTASPAGQPSGRMVLLKGFAAEGFDFFTSYQSRKAAELEGNPQAALVFWWIELDRQVRIEGTVSRMEETASDAYFATRPRSARIGAIASRQSSGVTDRGALEEAVARVTAEQPEDGAVQRPEHWGGYRVHPDAFEFWQGRHDRLHDRFRYSGKAGGAWEIERLQP